MFVTTDLEGGAFFFSPLARSYHPPTPSHYMSATMSHRPFYILHAETCPGAVRLYGRHADGTPACRRVEFQPWVLVPVRNQAGVYLNTIITDLPDSTEWLKRFVGVHEKEEFFRLPRWKWKQVDKEDQEQFDVCDEKVSPLGQFSAKTGLRAGVWSDLEERPPPPLLVCAYDLETEGLDPHKHRIMQCAIVFWSTDAPPDTAHPDSTVICVGNTVPAVSEDGTPQTPITCVNSELELLREFQRVIQRTRPDIVTGFNICAFDNTFLKTRSEVLRFKLNLSRGASKSNFKSKKLSSSALGENELTLLQSTMVEIDLFVFAKQTFLGLESYSLDFCSSTFLGDNKIDMPFGEMQQIFKEGDARELGRVADYCFKDSLLVVRLMHKWNALASILQECAVCYVASASAVTSTGRQAKIAPMLARELFVRGFALNRVPEDLHLEGGFEGATVLDTVPGLYSGACDQVLCCDFASLYPSLMITYGVSPELIVLGRAEGEAKTYDIGPVTLTMKHDDGSAILPSLLRRLLAERKAIRTQMKSETDHGTLAILDAGQKARKVLCNSVYGFLGAAQGVLPLTCLSALVTHLGRQTIEFTRRVCADEYGCTTIAGDTDSVMVQLPARPEGEEPATRVSYVFQKGQEMCDDITRRLPGILVLELEAVYWPSVYYRKKHYSAQVWESPSGPLPDIKIKGLRPVRRDAITFLRDTCTEILRVLVKVGDAKMAKKTAREAMNRLRAGDVLLQDLVFSKTLRTYTPDVISPHVLVAQKLRSKGRPPQLGTKVSYVLVKGPRKARPEDLCAHPDEVGQGKRTMDVDAYFERSFLKPVSDILAPVWPDADSAMKEEWRAGVDAVPQKQLKIDSFFK